MKSKNYFELKFDSWVGIKGKVYTDSKGIKWFTPIRGRTIVSNLDKDYKSKIEMDCKTRYYTSVIFKDSPGSYWREEIYPDSDNVEDIVKTSEEFIKSYNSTRLSESDQIEPIYIYKEEGCIIKRY